VTSPIGPIPVFTDLRDNARCLIPNPCSLLLSDETGFAAADAEESASALEEMNAEAEEMKRFAVELSF
jgi:hypothetical protein